jgi:hypothetical protein
MRVLVACEFSGTVRRAFRALGHDAWSCDLLPSEDNSPYHIQRDVISILDQNWDLMIAHPPCTYLANSGVRWLYIDGERNEARWALMAYATAFFERVLAAPIPMIAVENPIMHKHARALIDTPYSQIIQPWMFGHGETKATCLWLKHLPLLRVTRTVSGREGRIHKLSPSPDRWKERSKTYEGIATAMAEQWGGGDTAAIQRALFETF